MTRYELLQALEMMLPSRDDWFIADEDEGIVKVCFSVDPDSDDDDLELSDYEKGYLTAFYESDTHIQNEHSGRDEDNQWYGIQVGERMFDLCVWKEEGAESEVCVVYECFLNDDGFCRLS
jgi:hypothetical protein